jgi:hypothetical protein
MVGATGFDQEKTVKRPCGETIATICMIVVYAPLFLNGAISHKWAMESKFYSIQGLCPNHWLFREND